MPKNKKSKKQENPVIREHEHNQRYIYHLKKPVRHNGEHIKSVSIRRATVADAIAVEETGALGFNKKNAHYFSMLSGLSPDVFEKIDMSDWYQLLRGAGNFLGMGGLMSDS